MATGERGEYERGTRRYNSSSLLKGDISAHSYAPRGTYGSRPHYTNGNYRNITTREYGQSEQKESLHEHSTDRTSNSSPQHQHHQIKQPLANNGDARDNDTRKRKTVQDGAYATSSPTGQRNKRREWEEEDDPEEVHIARTSSTAKRPRSNDESGNDTPRDTRHESSKYGNSKVDYGNARTHSRSSCELGGWEDRPRSRESSEYNGRGRHDSHQGWEGRGKHYHEDRPAESGIEAAMFCRKKLWVGGLTSDITCEEIKKYFGTFGKLIYVMISPKGNAFVKFSTEAQALHAYRECYTASIRDKPMRVKYAIRKANKMPHNKLLYINNVPSGSTRTDLKNEFEKYGEIEDVQMFTVPYLYFFVTFVQEESAVKARKALKTKYFIQFGKNRADEKKPESPETAKTKDAPSSVQPFYISECQVNDVLEPLSDSQTLELSDLLNDLQPTNTAIRIRRDWILKHAENINDILLHISVMLVAKDNPFTLRLSTLFLIHDLLSYCTQRRICTEILDTVSALTLPHLQRVINKFHVDSEEESRPVLNILSLWEKYSVYPASVVEDLRHKFKTGEKDTQADELW